MVSALGQNRTRDSDPGPDGDSVAMAVAHGVAVAVVVAEAESIADDQRQSSLLRPIRENDDSDGLSSADDVDAVTAMKHMANLSGHIEDQELSMMAERGVFDDSLSESDLIGYLDESGSDDHIDSMDRLAMHKAASIKMIEPLSTNTKVQRHISHDSPGLLLCALAASE